MRDLVALSGGGDVLDSVRRHPSPAGCVIGTSGVSSLQAISAVSPNSGLIPHPLDSEARLSPPAVHRVPSSRTPSGLPFAIWLSSHAIFSNVLVWVHWQLSASR